MYIIKKQLERPMMPILLDDSDVPECLITFEPLNVFNERKYWWPKLLNALVAEIPSSSSEESDEELANLHDKLINLLPEKNKRKQKRFRNMCKQSGLSNFMGHAKGKETNGGLTDNCGEGCFPQSQRQVQCTFEILFLEAIHTTFVTKLARQCLLFGSRESKRTGKADFQFLLTCLRM